MGILMFILCEHFMLDASLSHENSGSFDFLNLVVVTYSFCRLNDLNSSSFRSDMAGVTRSAAPAGRPQNTPSHSLKLGVMRGSEGIMTFGRSLRSGVTRAVFPEDLKVSNRKIFDPQDKTLLLWNKLLVISCILAVSVDPLFLYLPVFQHEGMCLHIDESLAYTVTTLRTIIDAFYLVRMILQFRTAFIAPSSRVFGRGELVIDPKKIATRYIHRYFTVDFCSVMPFPQVYIMLALNFQICTSLELSDLFPIH